MRLQPIKDSISRLVPIRCQICGSWGHSSMGTQWICDACLTRLFDEKRVSVVSKPRRAVQTSLFS